MSSHADLIDDIVHRIASMKARDPDFLHEGFQPAETVEVATEDMSGPELRRFLLKQMTEELGPYYTAESLMRRWEVSRQAVYKGRVNGHLLGLKADDGQVLFPVWQFKPGSDEYPLLIDELVEVRKILEERNSDPLSQAIWLTAKVFGNKEAPLPAYLLLTDARGAQQVRSAARADVLRLAEDQIA
ncbi:hypothetical protein FQ154_20290 [Paeniglutamicibacter gangotriensis]|uniref:Uncharacterized protein n=1 Tax=Paeniglutamicibacter gangotriensis TaxID=254787 RepID=A0A5B0E2F1_9MICC|nr:hypothetical protein [Paeniglutamicibacter gangotriensis]KAA0973023.1 hypothetical protein FQ154_20290 [Paeniglutamicibacter gangotriensis]